LRQKLVRVVGGVVMATLAFSGATACKSDSSDSGGDAKACGYKIAFFGALSGGNAQLGINIRDGAKLAIDQYNKANASCKVDMVDKDSAGSADQAPPLAQSLVQDPKVLGVVGPAFSGESKVADPILSDAGVVMITPSATAPVLSTKGWKTFHRGLGNDASQGPADARYIKDDLKATKVFVIDDASEYGKGLSDLVKSTLGPLVKGSAVIKEQQVDFAAVVQQITAGGADAVFFGGYVREAAPFLKQLRESGSRAKFIAGDGVKETTLVTGAGAANAEGAVLSCPCVPGDKAAGTFAADYKAATSRDPSTYSAESFDAANIMLSGIKAGNTTREKLNDYVNKYEGQGVTTKFKFQANGEIDPSSVAVWAYVVRGGKIVAEKKLEQS
jgi:branched-chain amino acid transport system substrate-binding protein